MSHADGCPPQGQSAPVSVTSTATVTDDRGQAVKVGGSLTANLTPDCSEGTGRTQAGRVPGVPDGDGAVRVVRYN